MRIVPGAIFLLAILMTPLTPLMNYASQQQTQQVDTPPTPAPDKIPDSKNPPTKSSGKTYDGCIREKHGKYMLMTMDGQKYMLNSSQDLSAYKGHEVKITGDVSSDSAASAMSDSSEKDETAAQEKAEAEHMKRNRQTLNVTDLGMISTRCSVKKSSMDHDGGMSNPK